MTLPAVSRLAAPAAVAVGGLLLVASFTQPWTSDGLASSLSGQDLADLLLRGTLGSLVPRWAGLSLYLLPVCGGAVLLGVGVGGRAGRRLAAFSLGVAAVAGLLIAGALSWRPLTELSSAAAMVVVGVVVAVVGLIVEGRTRRAADPGRVEGRPPQG